MQVYMGSMNSRPAANTIVNSNVKFKWGSICGKSNRVANRMWFYWPVWPLCWTRRRLDRMPWPDRNPGWSFRRPLPTVWSWAGRTWRPCGGSLDSGGCREWPNPSADGTSSGCWFPCCPSPRCCCWFYSHYCCCSPLTSSDIRLIGNESLEIISSNRHLNEYK